MINKSTSLFRLLTRVCSELGLDLFETKEEYIAAGNSGHRMESRQKQQWQSATAGASPAAGHGLSMSCLGRSRSFSQHLMEQQVTEGNQYSSRCVLGETWQAMCDSKTGRKIHWAEPALCLGNHWKDKEGRGYPGYRVTFQLSSFLYSLWP